MRDACDERWKRFEKLQLPGTLFLPPVLHSLAGFPAFTGFHSTAELCVIRGIYGDERRGFWSSFFIVVVFQDITQRMGMQRHGYRFRVHNSRQKVEDRRGGITGGALSRKPRFVVMSWQEISKLSGCRSGKKLSKKRRNGSYDLNGRLMAASPKKSIFSSTSV